MQRHWHKKPLVIRQAIPGFKPLLDRAHLFDLAAQEEVQSRLVVQASADGSRGWRFRHGPFSRKSLPPFKQAGWTLLVQGGDLLDDLIISYATDGGGVGECMTYSIGFRAPSRGELAGELLQRLAQDAMDAAGLGWIL